MPAKRLLMLQLRSTGESIASKVEEGWDDMIDVVAREFELVAPTVRFSLVLPPLEPGAGSTSPRYMRLLPSSWPEILDTALASRANDGLVSIAVDGRLEERLSLLPADYAGIGIKRQQSPEQYESSERSCTHSPESVPQTPPSAEIAKVVMTASDGAAVCYKAKCKTTINRLLSAFARRSASDPDMLRVLDERRFRRIDCLTVGQWLDQHGVDVERVDDGLPILRASIQEEQCGGKPVIYLYPPSTAEVTVRVAVCPQWRFSALYPASLSGLQGPPSQQGYDEAVWRVRAESHAELVDLASGLEVSYLFWEAQQVRTASSATDKSAKWVEKQTPSFQPAHTRLSPHDSDVVLLSRGDVLGYIDRALKSLNLHTEARTSFITYWLPALDRHDHVALRFLPQADYERAAPLVLDPKPDVITRVFMLFQGVRSDDIYRWDRAMAQAREDIGFWRDVVGVQSVDRQSDTRLFRVLEWGGMEIK